MVSEGNALSCSWRWQPERGQGRDVEPYFDALAACNAGHAVPYGNDALSLKLEQRISEIFEHDASVFLVSTGSAANALSLAVLTPPWGSVLSHADAHINRDECGAPEFFTDGAKLVQLGGDNAKLDLAALKAQATRMVGDVHSVRPSCVSISQATEIGSVYSLDEIEAIGAICREAGLGLHMDGASFANALVTLGCSPAEMTWKRGVDVLSLGLPKTAPLASMPSCCYARTLPRPSRSGVSGLGN